MRRVLQGDYFTSDCASGPSDVEQNPPVLDKGTGVAGTVSLAAGSVPTRRPAQALVQVRDANTLIGVLYSHPDGTFVINVPAGTYTVSIADPASGSCSSTTATVTTGQLTQVELSCLLG